MAKLCVSDPPGFLQPGGPGTGSYTAKASYTLHKGSSSCSSYKEKAINVN
jgi:hypothetical protein